MKLSSKNRERLSWLLLESVLIVVSILLAFWIDAWWDNRQDDRRLDNWFSALEPALSENIEALSANLDFVADEAAQLEAFMSMPVGQVTSFPEESRADMLWSLWRLSTLNNRDAEIAALLGSREIDLVQDNELRKNFGVWLGLQDQFAEIHHLLQALSDDAMPALTSHDAYARALASDAPADVVVTDALLQQLKEDPEITAIAARKAAVSRIHLRYLARARDHNVVILEHIQSLE